MLFIFNNSLALKIIKTEMLTLFSNQFLKEKFEFERKRYCRLFHMF